MHPTIAGIMAANHGLITRKQAISNGLTAEWIDRHVRTGGWVAVRRGVYAEKVFWESLTTPEEQQRTRDRAASVRISAPHVMSHDSAALELGMQILRARPAMTHVTYPGHKGARHRHGVKHHLAPYQPDQVVTVNGIAVLDPARTAADIAREHGLQHGVVAYDSALRARVPRSRLLSAILPMENWRNVTVVREACQLSDPGSDGAGESLSRLLVEELGEGRPQTQFGLTAGGRVVWCDLRIGRHLFEFDGKLKYLRDGAYSQDMDPDEIVWQEKLRQDFVCGFKLGMSRIVWDDLWGRARAVALERLAREYADTVSRYGTSIDDLTPYIVRRPRPRPRAA